MKKLLILMAMALMIPSCGLADENKCVSQSDVISSWQAALNENKLDTSNVTYAICNTCECWYNSSIGSADYFKCLANEAEENEKSEKEQFDLLERAKKYGICKD